MIKDAIANIARSRQLCANERVGAEFHRALEGDLALLM
jgi:hypothetical protein